MPGHQVADFNTERSIFILILILRAFSFVTVTFLLFLSEGRGLFFRRTFCSGNMLRVSQLTLLL